MARVRPAVESVGGVSGGLPNLSSPYAMVEDPSSICLPDLGSRHCDGSTVRAEGAATVIMSISMLDDEEGEFIYVRVPTELAKWRVVWPKRSKFSTPAQQVVVHGRDVLWSAAIAVQQGLGLEIGDER